MKMSNEHVKNRRMQILKLVQNQSAVKTDDLVEMFRVSPMCIRRDLQYLEDQKLIRRFYGGAAACEANVQDVQRAEIIKCREKISRYAAKLITDGSTLFINGSMTALNALKYVTARDVRVTTNNCRAIGQEYTDSMRIVLTGGVIRGHIMAGQNVMRCLLESRADIALIGCAAISENGELSYDIPTEIGINEAMITRTKGEVYILADHSKINAMSRQLHHYGSCIYERPWTLITDSKTDEGIVNRLREDGHTVIVV